MDRALEKILLKVQKPARYTGGEYNAVVKNRDEVDLRFALCFPDTYEIGMSNLGVRILYGMMNALPGVWCERVFAPWGDMEEEMRRAGVPLWGLESGDSIGGFDIIGFSLGYEMAYTSVLNMLDLAGLPVRSADRKGLTPLVIAGGTCAYNGEPLAPFVDIFSLGEGEDVTAELIDLVRQAKREGWEKAELLRRASHIPGLYVPSLYDVSYRADGTVAAITPKDGTPETVCKRVVGDMDLAYYPEKTIVPSTEIVQDRVTLELFRGCIRGCRFCQAGFCYRPVRARSPEVLLRQAKAACEDSGYQQITLSSLSSSDYRPLSGLCDELLRYCEPNHIKLALPSLRADSFSVELMQQLQSGGRKSGLTFAPEAGTQRLRDAINKNLTEQDVLTACATAFSGGWSGVKLYFMLGLPTETDEDVLGIAELTYKVYLAWRENAPNKNRGVRITVSTACFIPKPHTPFQWEAQVTEAEYRRRVDLLREAFQRNKCVTYNWHDADTSIAEAILARGDRRLADVVEEVWRQGGRLESWQEYFSLERWKAAMARFGLDPAFYTTRPREMDEILPWDMISVGVRKDFLRRERERCYEGRTTPDCRTACAGCGANALMPGGVCDA